MQASSMQSWLDSYCGEREGVLGGLIMLTAKSTRQPGVAAQWPDGAARNESLFSAARDAYDGHAPVVRSRLATDSAASGRGQVISLPVRAGNKAVGAFALEIDSDKPELRQQRLAEMVRAAAALGVAFEADAKAAAAQPQGATLLHIQAAVLSHERLAASATAFVGELAQAMDFERVSIGLADGAYAKVLAVSSGTQLADAGGAQRALAAAMDEAIAQSATILYPARADERPRITLAHADLGRRLGGAVCTIPLCAGGQVFGALTLERSGTRGIDAGEIAACEHIASLVGPILRLQHESERSWHARLRQATVRVWDGTVGPGRWVGRLGVAALVAAAIGALFIPVGYRVSAPARLEGAVQRVLVAPVDGFLRQVNARPGDRVAAEQVLVELAEQDLKLEQRKWESELAQHDNAQRVALARSDRGQYMMDLAKAEGARAQLALIHEQLARSRIRAPFDGVVIKGDLTQSLGAPVQRGEVLLTIAPADRFRLIVEVDERDVGDLRVGMNGALALAALPDQALAFRVARVTPVSSPRDGRNFFEVEGALEGLPATVQPGLQGVAKILAGERSLAWIWTHRFTDWLRLALWSWRI